MIHSGKIEGGHFRPFDSKHFLDSIKKLEGKFVEVEIRTEKRKRSDRLNRYYWGVVIEYISAETGYTAEETHLFLKTKFLGHKIITIGGERHPVLNSSAELTTDQFQQYILEITRWAGEFLQLTIPEPNQ